MTQYMQEAGAMKQAELHLKALKVRVKDKHAAVLSRMARQVNTIWNYLNETSCRAIRERGLASLEEGGSYAQ